MANCINIEGERAKRFFSLLADLADATVSLHTASTLFPNVAAMKPGDMHPPTTVQAFAMAMGAIVGDMMTLANGDDIKQREADHAQK